MSHLNKFHRGFYDIIHVTEKTSLSQYADIGTFHTSNIHIQRDYTAYFTDLNKALAFLKLSLCYTGLSFLR